MFRVGVVICCITATVYYGGLCTEKYISNPTTITSDMVPISELPPLQWSICRQVYFSDCVIPDMNYFYNYYDGDKGTTFITLSMYIIKIAIYYLLIKILYLNIS